MADDNVGQSSAEEEMPVVSLIEGRSKRSTAGRHMSALLNAEADDDLALLFEEVDDDNEFSVNAEEEGGEEDDMGLDSSSDEEDQGPNARSDDYEGETQLQKEEKAEKKKRRAQQDLRFKITSKKVKIDPTAVSAVPAPPRPKKKSERISWIPTPEEGPTRSSSRRQTMQNKELTHARLKDSEEKRIRLIATMEEAAKRKAHLKPKEMTQAERLAEAERVERQNSKSLNRWEEMERRKADERKAKIEALQNRRLEGPVMSYWSGVATWVDGRLTRLGKVDITPKLEKEDNTRKKSKKSDKEEKTTTEQKPADISATSPATTQPLPPTISESAAGPATSGGENMSKETQDSTLTEKTDPLPVQGSDAKPESTTVTATGDSTVSTPSLARSPKPVSDDAQTIEPTADEGSQMEGTGLPKKTPEGKAIENEPESEQAPESRVESKPEEAAKDPVPGTEDLQMLDEVPTPKLEAQEQEQEQKNQDPTPPEGNGIDIPKEPAAESTTTQPAPDTVTAPQAVSPPSTVAAAPDAPTAPVPPNQEGEVTAAIQQEQVAPEVQLVQPAAIAGEVPQPQIPQHPPVIEHAGRTLTVLENFDDKTAQSREFSIYFNAKKPPRLAKISSSLCVITSLPSRYRDPETALPFANAYAYNEIRNTVTQKYAWSTMLGCYVGPAGVAARGVPERFLDPKAPPPEKVSEKKDSSGDGEPADGNKDKAGETTKASECATNASTPAATTPTPAPAPAPTAATETGAGDPMEVDK
ncbi:YL1 nuclear protein-domain-containing protein [Aspergillus pseudotamarii]|uniref:YL1 nuclear protein-domain-containing protein n=1 Tax=Aspergillus pseudotamarii TaxID=132259 RepID=A0A5N6SL61_ASPPS|nr:YL1 nuclear protein-domain-containing protein [Aspergillus pseudotamarii]KAE8134649.1 YL1 nuclear protein-domain-containing protein [Aspergillus pseudotamarii]